MGRKNKNLPDPIDLSKFFDPDAPPGEPVLNQVKDPLTGAVYGPGVRVDEDGTVTFLDSEQTSLFDVDNSEAKVEASNAHEVNCAFCGTVIDVNSKSTYAETTSWVHGAKRDSAVLRHYTGRHACENCITLMKSGLGAEQQEVFESAETGNASNTVGDIVTDISLPYRLGYIDGISGKPKLLPPERSGMVDEYEAGYEAGAEKRSAQEEWPGSSRPRLGPEPESDGGGAYF